MVMPHAMALLAAAYPPDRRARALGVFSSVSGLATLGGPVVGGAIAQGGSWQWIFWLNIPIGAILIPLARTRIPESTAPARRLDVGGLSLVTIGALGLVWGLIKGNSLGWSSPQVLGSLVVGAAGLATFVAWELRVEQPMLPMRLFARRGFAAGNASGFLLYIPVFGVVFLMAQFFQISGHTGPLGAGLRTVPWTGALFLVFGALGLIGMQILSRGGVTVLTPKFVNVLLLGSFLLLLLVLVPGFGVQVNGARRWFAAGPRTWRTISSQQAVVLPG